MFDQVYGDNPSTFTVHVSTPSADGSLHVRLGGEFDRDEAEPMVALVRAAIERHTPAAVHVDASGLTFLDSGGIHALLRCRESAVAAGASFSVRGVTPEVYRILDVTGLVALFNVSENPSGAPV